MQIILEFLRDFIEILMNMAPFLLMGFMFAGLLYAFMPSRKINKYFNDRPLASAIRAAVFGVPLPLCSCGVIPTGTALYRNGASKGSTVSFLISTPQTGIDSILATFSLMGLPMAIIRPVTAFITGVLGGYITSKLTKEPKAKDDINGKSFESCSLNQKKLKEDDITNMSFLHKLLVAFKYGFVDFMGDIAKWLSIGLILAALISAFIPNDFAILVNMPPIVQMLLVLIVSIPLYICATGSIPLAAVLIMKGLSPGAAFILLMAGPATNAATITMIKKVMGTKTLIVYLSTIISGAIVSGLFIDYLFPISWFLDIATNSISVHAMNSFSWWRIASAVILLILLTYSFIRQMMASRNYKKSKTLEQTIKSKNNIMESIEFKVNGMVCGHCKASVVSNLNKLPFIREVNVDLNSKLVKVTGDKIDMKLVKKTINSIGYEFCEK